MHAEAAHSLEPAVNNQGITAYNGCLQMEITVHGKMAHAPIPDTGITMEIRRLLRADAWKPDNRNAALVQALQRHGQAVFSETIPTSGTPLYTDVRLFAAAGIPAAIYGAGRRRWGAGAAGVAGGRLSGAGVLGRSGLALLDLLWPGIPPAGQSAELQPWCKKLKGMIHLLSFRFS